MGGVRARGVSSAAVPGVVCRRTRALHLTGPAFRAFASSQRPRQLNMVVSRQGSLAWSFPAGYSMKVSLKVWLDRLKDEDEAVRKRARRTFCAMSPADKKAVPELIDALNSGDKVARYWATRGLSGIGPAAKAAVPSLTEALHTEDSDFRFWVVTALSSIGSEAQAAIPPLIELLHDPVFGIRQAVADSLIRIDPEANGVVPALVETLDKDENEFVREEVIRALGQIATPQSLRALVNALVDRNPDVRRYAAIGLKMLGFKAKPVIQDVRKALASKLDNIMRGDLEIALKRMEG
jgi:HEAT repeat protein